MSTRAQTANGVDSPKRTAVPFVRRFAQLQALALVPIIAVALVIGSIISPAFFTRVNLVDNVIALSAPLGILVIAESIILIGGYFDLSLQSTAGLAPMLLAVFLSPGGLNRGLHLSAWLAWPAMLAAAILIGLFNAFLVAKLELNAFIVTLATLILLEGVTLGISNGQTYTDLPTPVTYLGSANWLGVPAQAWIFVLAFALAYFVMTFMPIGRSIYAMGGNVQAAKAAGIRTVPLTFLLFVAGGLLSVAAGLLLASQTAAVTPTLGSNIIFTVFAAAVLGGISLNGGRGNLIGAGLGVILLGIIQDILTLSNVPSFWINAAYGGIILGALIVGRASAFLRVRLTHRARLWPPPDDRRRFQRRGKPDA